MFSNSVRIKGSCKYYVRMDHA